MFVNYFKDDSRSSPINLAAGRLVLGFWVVWKTVWYDWSRHVETAYWTAASTSFEWTIPVSAPWLLTVEKWLLIGLAALFVVGYRIRVTATAGSFLLAPLATVRQTMVTSGETSAMFIGSFMLLFFALYAETDRLSIDGISRTGSPSVESLVGRLRASADHRYPMPAMKYSLLLLAILYFSTGTSKVIDGNGLGFVAPDNLTRLVLVRSYVYPWHDVQLLVVDYPALGVLGGVGTLALELGFLIAVLVGTGFVPIVLGLIAFTLSNVALLGIFFVDNLFFFGLFVAFDRAHARLALDRELDLVFDEQCEFCVRWLYPFRLLDVNETVTFHPQQDASNRYSDGGDVDLDRSIRVFDGADAYEGYDALRELLRQYRIFLPLVWVMGTPPARAVGQRGFKYIADDQDGALSRQAEG